MSKQDDGAAEKVPRMIKMRENNFLFFSIQAFIAQRHLSDTFVIF